MTRPEHPSLVYLDTNALVYAISDKPAGEPVAELLRLAVAKKVIVAISTLSYVEVRGYGNADPYPAELDRQVIDYLDSEHLLHIDFNRRVALRARRISYDYKLKTLDAMHMASAVVAGADVLMTADGDFRPGRLSPGRMIEGVWVDAPYAPGDPPLFSA
ncbi:MAG TPA: PIN domain-containing protein [Pseudonocardia sp.]